MQAVFNWFNLENSESDAGAEEVKKNIVDVAGAGHGDELGDFDGESGAESAEKKAEEIVLWLKKKREEKGERRKGENVTEDIVEEKIGRDVAGHKFCRIGGDSVKRNEINWARIVKEDIFIEFVAVRITVKLGEGDNKEDI